MNFHGAPSLPDSTFRAPKPRAEFADAMTETPFDLVECKNDTTVTVSGPLQHRCPYVNEIDEGVITLTWHTRGASIELHSLRQYLDQFNDERVSHETLTAFIGAVIDASPGIELVSVETTWDTAGMEVRCSTSPTPVGRP